MSNTINFEFNGEYLLLCKWPGTLDTWKNYNEKIEKKEGININGMFAVNNELLFEIEEDIFKFKVGKREDHYIRLDSNVFGTTNNFFFSENVHFHSNLFIANRNISILKKIDKLLNSDFYVTDEPEDIDNSIDIKTYSEIIKHFPGTAELNRYTQYRISNILRNFFPACDKYEQIYEKFIDRKNEMVSRITNIEAGDNYFDKIKKEEYQYAYDELKLLLESCSGISEEQWQKKVQGILKLLYPQYVYYDRKIRFKGVEGYDKEPDFVLVDTNGFVDIMEMKKPDMRLLRKSPYRNNYIPTREFSGAIQQAEKYIHCLISNNESKDDVRKKLEKNMGKSLGVGFVSPKGILLAGSNTEFENKQQRDDFELIRRQYKNIVDIITYDDLLERIKNALDFLS